MLNDINCVRLEPNQNGKIQVFVTDKKDSSRVIQLALSPEEARSLVLRLSFMAEQARRGA